MDTGKTPSKDNLPDELLDAAHAITQVGSDIFTFGGFPRVGIEKVMIEARRRWILACKFDRALHMWDPTLVPTPRYLVKVLYGAANPGAAEKAWLDAVFLWPDQDSQESAADRLSLLDDDGAANTAAHNARIRIVELKGSYRSAREKNNRKQMAKIKKALGSQRLRVRARENSHHLHPELWIRYVVQRAHKKRSLRSNGSWRQDARDELGQIISREPSLEFDALGVCFVFRASYQWIKRNRKIKSNHELLLDLNGMSVSDAACEATARLLRAIGYPNAPSSRSIRRIIESSKFIKAMNSSDHS